MPPTSHSPWIVALSVEIDKHEPGFCGAFFRASAERRQVIASYLARRASAIKDMAELGRFLLSARHSTILVEAHGCIIRGLRGALRLAGEEVHGRRFYSLLQAVFANPRHSKLTDCVLGVGSLNLGRLRTAYILPLPICRSSVVECINGNEELLDVLTAYRLLVSRGVREADLAEAIKSAHNRFGLARAFGKQILQCSAQSHPIPGSSRYRPIRTGSELHGIARRYQNCARAYTVDLIEDEPSHAFAEFRHEGEGAIVHLVRDRDQWQLFGLHGRQNKLPTMALRDEAASYLAGNGVDVTGGGGRTWSKWDAVRRITSLDDFDEAWEPENA